MRVRIISRLLWTIESLFFYPKLKRRISKLPVLVHQPVILDVGANSGQSIKFFRKIFKESRIYAFEPNPSVYLDLVKNCSKNTFCYSYALGEVNTKADLFVSEFHETSSLNSPNKSSRWYRLKQQILGLDDSGITNKLKVDVKTIDSVTVDLGIEEIFLLKIDVEGMEEKVLLGAIETIRRCKPVIFIEFLKSDPKKLKRQIEELGYEIREILTENFLCFPTDR